MKLACKTFAKNCLTVLDCLFLPGNKFKPYCKWPGASSQTSGGGGSGVELLRRAEAFARGRQRSACSGGRGNPQRFCLSNTITSLLVFLLG